MFFPGLTRWQRIKRWLCQRKVRDFTHLTVPRLSRPFADIKAEQLCRALEVGKYDGSVRGWELKIEPIQATMKNVVFWDHPVRKEGGIECHAVLLPDGKWYEFWHDGRSWRQTIWSGTLPWLGKKIEVCGDRLGWWDVWRVGRRLSPRRSPIASIRRILFKIRGGSR